jgi:hypothetical protein
MVGLAAFALLLVSGRSVDLLGSHDRMALLLSLFAVAVAFWWTGRIELVVGYLIVGGLVLRWILMPPGGVGGSDVLAAINEGIGVWLAGGNPYDHFYTQTRPPGQPLPYPPGALLVHLPGHLANGLAGVQWTQLAGSALALGLLARSAARSSWLAGIAGLALYAGAPNLAILTADGSNDTLTGALLLLAIVLTAGALRTRDPGSLIVAGSAAALAVSTKQLALPIVLALAAYVVRSLGWRRALDYVGFGAAFLLMVSIPFLLMGPLEFVEALTSVAAHDDIFGWNIWAMVLGFGLTPWDRETALMLTIGVAVVALIATAGVPTRTLAGAVLCGVVATVAIMFAARWSTPAYFGLFLPALTMLPSLAFESRQDPASQPEGYA